MTTKFPGQSLNDSRILSDSKPPAGRHYSHSLSRRSFSRNPQYNTKDNTIETLQKILKPEWQVDFHHETNHEGDDDANVDGDNNERQKQTENPSNSNNSDTSFISDSVKRQERLYLKSVNLKLLEVPIQDNLESLLKYQTILNDSRVYLKPLFDYLMKFENDLNKLSSEMEFLQNRSTSLNSEIEEKSKIEKLLTPVLNDLIIPPEIIKSIVNDQIDEDWLENLRFISEKREIFLKYKGLESLTELSEILDELELKLTERIRDFIIIQIKNIRRVNTNSQLIQLNMLRVKEIYQFLNDKNPSLSLELRQAYCYTMRWYYYSNFVKYLSSLERLNLIRIGSNVLLGSSDDDSSSSSTSSFFGLGGVVSGSSGSSSSGGAHHGSGGGAGNAVGNGGGYDEVSINEYLINLTKRLEILKKKPNEGVMPAQIAETNNLKYNLENHFRNFNQALLDNASSEYLFLTEFFKISSFETMNELSKLIFNPIYQLGYNFTKFLIADTYDHFGILLMIRLCQSMEYELQHRRVPIMEDYFNYQLILLWPRFQTLIDENCNSIKRTVSSSSLLKQINKNVMIPLSLTQNFGITVLNFLKLSSNLVFELETSEPLTNSVMRLCSEFENSILKLGANNKKKELFYYNNFYLVWSILTSEEFQVVGGAGKGEEAGGSGSGSGILGESQIEHFKKLADAYSG